MADFADEYSSPDDWQTSTDAPTPAPAPDFATDFAKAQRQNEWGTDDSTNPVSSGAWQTADFLQLNRDVTDALGYTDPEKASFDPVYSKTPPPPPPEDKGFVKTIMEFIKNPENKNITALGSSFLSGMFNQKYKQAQSDAQKSNAEANMMNANTSAAAQALKEKNNKAVGLINFKQGDNKYQDLMAEKRARSGAPL